MASTLHNRRDSAILSGVKKYVAFVWIGIFLALALLPGGGAQEPQKDPATATAPAAPKLQLAKTIDVIVLDPGHGATDPGARGPGGVTESEIVLSLAREIQTRLQSSGLRVFLTRTGNENPSYDDRAAIVNSHRGALFVSLHIASTGRLGTARAYYQPSTGVTSTSGNGVAPPGWITWEEAQLPYAELSRRLAELLQVQLAQTLEGSLEIPRAAQVRVLKSVTAPAVAIEVASVAPGDPQKLVALAPAIATAIEKTVAAFRPVYEAGAR